MQIKLFKCIHLYINYISDVTYIMIPLCALVFSLFQYKQIQTTDKDIHMKEKDGNWMPK